MFDTARKVYLLLLILFMISISGCASFMPFQERELPPILEQDEVIRSHVKLGRIQVTREVYGVADYMINPDIRKWGFQAIREQAAKMGADAVILPEVTGNTTTFGVILPVTEYRASGIAIKFK